MAYRRSKLFSVLAVVTVLLLVATACSSNDALARQANAGGNKNFIAGDGSVTVFAPSTRGAPVKFTSSLYDSTKVPAWTITLVFGSIWADQAWGRYWGWDTKEVWTFVIWVVYAGYLHARATRGWNGTRSAWLSITGYLCVLFNFGIVNVFFAGLHSYAGLTA